MRMQLLVYLISSWMMCYLPSSCRISFLIYVAFELTLITELVPLNLSGASVGALKLSIVSWNGKQQQLATPSILVTIFV